MDNKRKGYCSFFGHRSVQNENLIEEKLLAIIEKIIIEENITNFLFGGFSDFDTICNKIVSKLQNKYTFIKKIFCYSDEMDLKRIKDLTKYDELLFLPVVFNYWYTRIYYRNCEMIKKSDIIIFYVENRENSGAYKMYGYAQKSKKRILNVFD